MAGDEPTDGAVAPDGSPVAVYLALPPAATFEPVLASIPPWTSVLDLGCGVGRLANLLAAQGHEVVGVDTSPDMLAHLHPDVEAVQARIEDLDLGRRFDVVVLASHLVNVPDTWSRVAMLAAAREHCEADGTVLLQHHPTDRFDGDHDVEVGDVAISLRSHGWRGDVVSATVTYALPDGRSWTQPFTTQVLGDEALDTLLRANGLRRTSRLSPDWLAASPA